MQRYKQLVTAGVVLSIVGVLAGCSTGNGTSPASNATNITGTRNSTASPPSNTTTSNIPTGMTTQDTPYLTIESPAVHAFKPGSTIKVEGVVDGRLKSGSKVTASLYWGNKANSSRLVHAQTYDVANGGTFGGDFNVPNTSFVGASGGEFVLVIQYPHAKSVTIPMATPEVKAVSPATAGMAHLNLTNAQINNIQDSLKHIDASNPASMKFGNGGKIFVPTEILKGEKFLGADSGGNVEFGTYVTLNFTGFKVMCGDKAVSQMAIRKTSTVKLANGATGTWYVSDPAAGGTTYYLMTSNGSTYITFYSNLKTVSHDELQEMAGSMTFLGLFQ